MLSSANKITTPKIMGVVNITPDSFSDGGQFSSVDAAVSHAVQLVEEGADILDIGGESTRPGADVVSVDEELMRILPVIEALVGKTDAAISIDTRKPEVAVEAVKAGASIWNDVSALTYARDSTEIAKALGCEVVLMHAQGDPKTMQEQPQYEDVIAEVFDFLNSRVEMCVNAGVDRRKLIIDPGIGFGKTLEHNLVLLAELERFTEIAPVLLGVSRKSFIAAIGQAQNGNKPAADERLGGSVAAVLAARGASFLRVHDVAATRQALAVFEAIETMKTKG